MSPGLLSFADEIVPDFVGIFGKIDPICQPPYDIHILAIIASNETCIS